jgi:hypothetical protein
MKILAAAVLGITSKPKPKPKDEPKPEEAAKAKESKKKGKTDGADEEMPPLEDAEQDRMDID